MNVAGILNTRAASYAALALVGAVVLYVVTKKLGDAAEKALENVNPASDQNFAYRGVNAVGAAASGDPSWSLGSWLYDRFNPPYDPNAVYEPRSLAVRKEAAQYAGVMQ